MLPRLVYLIFAINIWFATCILSVVAAKTSDSNYSKPTGPQNWQVLLIPKLQGIRPSEVTQVNQLIRAPASTSLLDAIDSGLTQKFRENNVEVISNSRFFSDCTLAYCGNDNIQATLESIKEQSSDIGLVVFYTVTPTDAFYNRLATLDGINDQAAQQPLHLEINVIDPITFKIVMSEHLRLIETISYQSLFRLAQDMGTIVLHNIEELTPKRQYSIHLNNFVFEELNGFSTYIIGDPNNHYLKLKTSSQKNTMFGQFFPVQITQYELLSTMSQESIADFIERFFYQRGLGIDIDIETRRPSNGEIILDITRSGNPYTPSMLSSLLMILLCFSVIIWFIRRNVLNAKLEYYSEHRNATKWLKTHQDAKFGLYFLAKRWASPAIYWSRVAEESNELCNQAKLYFDAGDITTAKLFLSKSMHMDKGNAAALRLTDKIKEFEVSGDKLSKDEQWIRNKLAKALSNHKQRKPLKALKQLYQADELASENKKLNKQSRAINKLIKRIKKSAAKPIEAFVLNSVGDTGGIVVFNTKKVYLGRLPKTVDLTWISMRDGIFPINHTFVSRVGKHGEIVREEGIFYYKDLDSKNGSFINRKKCKPNQRVRLTNTDLLQLGSKHPAKSVGLDIVIPKDFSYMQLSFNEFANDLLAKDELDKLWPDNLIAQCNDMVYLNQSVVLLIHKKSGALKVVGMNELSVSVDEDQMCIPVAQISLEPAPMLKPVNQDINLLIDNIMVLGEMPILVPCELKIEEFIVKFNSYEVTANPFNQQELLE